MSDKHITVEFHKSGRGKAQCPADPDFPEGKRIIMAPADVPMCEVGLPYPAPECGTFLVKCDVCHLSVSVTAAGRPDDPHSLQVACLTPRTVQ